MRKNELLTLRVESFGAEGEGVSRLVRETCDATVSIPMSGHLDSLNASVAAGILMAEVQHQRAK